LDLVYLCIGLAELVACREFDGSVVVIVKVRCLKGVGGVGSVGSVGVVIIDIVIITSVVVIIVVIVIGIVSKVGLRGWHGAGVVGGGCHELTTLFK